MMVIYLPVKFEFDWTKHFQVRVRKRKCCRIDKWTNERTELHQFRKEPSNDGDLSQSVGGNHRQSGHSYVVYL